MTRLIGNTEYVDSVAVGTKCDSDNAELVASGSRDKTVHCWAIPPGECIQVLTVHSSDVRFVAVSTDGNRIAAGSRK